MADEPKEPGCGWTMEALWRELVTKATDDYRKRVRSSAVEKNLLVAGYRAGLRDALRHLEGMGVLTAYPDDGEGTAPDWPKTEES